MLVRFFIYYLVEKNNDQPNKRSIYKKKQRSSKVSIQKIQDYASKFDEQNEPKKNYETKKSMLRVRRKIL